MLIDEHVVAVPAPEVVVISLGTETILVDGSARATVLDPTGSLIWSSLDGTSSLGAIAAELSELVGADPAIVRHDVIAFARAIADAGLLGVEGGSGPEVGVAAGASGTGGELLATRVVGGDGGVTSLADLLGRRALLVNWDPSCRFCAAIAPDLAAVRADLAARGTDLILLATPTATTPVAEAAPLDGLPASVVLAPGEPGPFGPRGTPAAVLVDGTGARSSDPVVGSNDVVALAAHLAGVEPHVRRDPSGRRVRYLPPRGGACAPGRDRRVSDERLEVHAYDIAAHRVGIAVGGERAAAVLDDLLGTRVADPDVVPSLSLVLAGSDGAETPSAVRLSTLDRLGGRPVVRTRNPARAARALLAELFEATSPARDVPGSLRLRSVAVVDGDRAVLVPSGAFRQWPGLQAALARRGLGVADEPVPRLDLDAAEVILAGRLVAHDGAIIERLDVGLRPGALERPAPSPGRYHLRAWFVMDADVVGELRSAAQAVAALLREVHVDGNGAVELRRLAAGMDRFATLPLPAGPVARVADEIGAAIRARAAQTVGGSA